MLGDEFRQELYLLDASQGHQSYQRRKIKIHARSPLPDFPQRVERHVDAEGDLSLVLINTLVW